MRLPLEGLRVVDLTVVWAGPFAAALLSDLGAEVIRVESIQRWDTNIRIAQPLRKDFLAHHPDRDPEDRSVKASEISANFHSVSRNRKSVTMDLSRPEGREAFQRLIKVSDIFVENNAAPVVESLQITYDVLSRVNPRLIMISMAGFGATGPYKNYRAYGANMEAVVGHALLRGYADMDATNNSSVFFADACGGATGAFGVLAALYHRSKTGRGQYIDMSQAENVAHAFGQALMDYSMNGRVQTTLGNRDASRAPQGVYPSLGEDAWIAISCGTDAEFRGLVETMGRPELAADARFAGGLARHAHQDEIDAEIAAWTATREHYEAFHALQAAGVPCSPVLTVAEVFTDPHLQDRDMWQQLTHPVAGTHWFLKPGISHMSETPIGYRWLGPTLGEHNEEVYKDLLGYTEEEYQWFVENQHAGQTFVTERPITAPPGS